MKFKFNLYGCVLYCEWIVVMYGIISRVFEVFYNVRIFFNLFEWIVFGNIVGLSFFFDDGLYYDFCLYFCLYFFNMD